MDRISSCTTRSFSKTRTVLSVPSEVANLSAIAFHRKKALGVAFLRVIGISRDTAMREEELLFILYKNYNCFLRTLEITIYKLFQWLTNKEKQACVIPSLFYPR